MPHTLSGYPTEILISIISKMNRTAFLRLSRSCKWIHNTIQENERHIRNFVTNDIITITIHKPTQDPIYGDHAQGPPSSYFKLTVNNEETVDDFEPCETFCWKLKRFSGMRVAELIINYAMFDDINDLAVYLHSEKITCEKLIFHFPQEKRSIPPGLIAILKPLKLVIHPCSVDHNNIVLGSYDHAAVNVEHISFVQVQEEDVNRTLAMHSILKKTSISIYYINNYMRHNEPQRFENVYRHLLTFYKRFMGSTDNHSIRNIYAEYGDNSNNLKDFQFYCDDARGKSEDFYCDGARGKSEDFYCDGARGKSEDFYCDGARGKSEDFYCDGARGKSEDFYCDGARGKSEDPIIGNLEDADALLMYITGQETATSSSYENYDYQNYQQAPIANPYNPFGLYAGQGSSGSWQVPGTSYGRPVEPRRESLLLKKYAPFSDGFYTDRLVISITTGRKEKEFILTLFADSLKRQKIYFAIAVLTDWASYERFLGLIDTRNFVFPMRDIEKEIKQIICPEFQ